MENTPDKDSESTPEVQDPGRRRLLKALAAGGVVTAASMVPGKWSSPVLKSGVLPAHAQVTPTPNRYEVRCGAWDSRIGESNNGLIIEFFGTATAWDTLNGVGVDGAQLVASAEVAPLDSRAESDITDSNGIANFVIPVPASEILFPTVTITVNYGLPDTYGDDTCSQDVGVQIPT